MLIVEFSSQWDRAIGGLFHLLFLLLIMFPHFILYTFCSACLLLNFRLKGTGRLGSFSPAFSPFNDVSTLYP